MKKTAFAALAFSMAPLMAHATVYDSFVAENSKINFTYQQMGVSLTGSFDAFDGSLQFDSENPDNASVRLHIPLVSTDTGSTDGDEEVVKKEWFNTAEFPNASFESTSVSNKGDHQYDVNGTLTIKGQSKTISFPVTFNETAEGLGEFNGEFTIQRGDFSVGEGAWAAYDIVANDVVIRFTIMAKAQ